jgi:hypothetical protein
MTKSKSKTRKSALSHQAREIQRVLTILPRNRAAFLQHLRSAGFKRDYASSDYEKFREEFNGLIGALDLEYVFNNVEEAFPANPKAVVINLFERLLGESSLDRLVYRASVLGSLALLKWGREAQERMIYEELAELQQAMCKYARATRKDPARAAIVDELADVFIMGVQALLLYGISEEQLAAKIGEKLARLEGRL